MNPFTDKRVRIKTLYLLGTRNKRFYSSYNLEASVVPHLERAPLDE
jgi:hypothetical protein